jgi:hypothetical protein
MLRNSEKFNEKVRTHVFDCLVDNDESNKEVLQKVVNEFKNWHYQYKLLFRTKSEAFISFLHSSPKSIRPVTTYYEQLKIMQGWYECTDEQMTAYDEDQIDFCYFGAIYLQFYNLCDVMNIDF